MLSEIFEKVEDSRQQGKVSYEQKDVILSAFAMMFFQDPSLLEFQRRWEEDFQTSNLQSVFMINRSPEDTQFRKILDRVNPHQLSRCFNALFKVLQRGKYIEPYKFLYDSYLVAIDGSGYFHSEKVHCPHCLTTKKTNGKIQCQHQILQTVMLHPDKKQVIPFRPEEISNKDMEQGGVQDCEIEAAKRFISSFRTSHPKLKVILNGDGLYSKASVISLAKKRQFSYIFVAKPGDHDYLFQNFSELKYTKECHHKEICDEKDNMHSYRWINGISLNQSSDIRVNFIEYELYNSKKGKVTYKNTWVTDLIISPDNVAKIVLGGRARWKIENETFNTLKNQGYHIEHNYGHGKQNLSMNFFILNLLAFYLHQIFEMTDKLYQQVREKIGRRDELWNRLRAVFNIMLFQSWEDLLIRVRGKPL